MDTPIILIVASQYVLCVFLQSFFLHRYAAHGMFTMTRAWERFFHLATYLGMGPSYMVPRAYALMHREHHAFSDTEKDPHSPCTRRFIPWILRVKRSYNDYARNRASPEKRFEDGRYPVWSFIDTLAISWWAQCAWVALYGLFYWRFATVWWEYLFVPIHYTMGPLQGVVVNWCGHRYGYRNFAISDASCNTLPVDIAIGGELYQNNHHKYPMSPNFAIRRFELDLTYQCIRVFVWLGIIRLAKNVQTPHYP